MKKILLIAGLLLTLSACENAKGFGNNMLTGSMTYYYVLVYSQITENKYYHIKGWKEYGPEGLTIDEYKIGNYVGLELQLNNGDVIYRYEQGLSYEMSKNENPEYTALYGLIGD